MVLPELTTWLAADGLGLTGDINLFYSLMPPDDAVGGLVSVCLYEYGGMPNEPEMGKLTTRLEFPSIQAVARGLANDYDGPRLMMNNVVTSFVKILNQNLSAVRYLAVEPMQPPFLMRRDDNFRVYIACNFKVSKRYSPS